MRKEYSLLYYPILWNSLAVQPSLTFHGIQLYKRFYRKDLKAFVYIFTLFPELNFDFCSPLKQSKVVNYCMLGMPCLLISHRKSQSYQAFFCTVQNFYCILQKCYVNSDCPSVGKPFIFPKQQTDYPRQVYKGKNKDTSKKGKI